MKITVQTSTTATEFGTNMLSSDPLNLTRDGGSNKEDWSFRELATLYDMGRNWQNALYFSMLIDGKVWAFNPAHVIRMCVVLTPTEEREYEEWRRKG